MLLQLSTQSKSLIFKTFQSDHCCILYVCETDTNMSSHTSVQSALASLDLWVCLTHLLSLCTGAPCMHLH